MQVRATLWGVWGSSAAHPQSLWLSNACRLPVLLAPAPAATQPLASPDPDLLPDEVLAELLAALPLRQLVALSAASRRLQRIVTLSPRVLHSADTSKVGRGSCGGGHLGVGPRACACCVAQGSRAGCKGRRQVKAWLRLLQR